MCPKLVMFEDDGADCWGKEATRRRLKGEVICANDF